MMKKIIFSILLFGMVVTTIFFYYSKINQSVTKIPDIFESSVKNEISTLIVPRQSVAGQQRADLFGRVTKTKNDYKTIVLVASNYDNFSQSDIITTDKTWDLSSRILSPDKKTIAGLETEGRVAVANFDFEGDNDMINVLNNISAYFPKAKIVPLLVKEQTSSENIQNVVESLHSNCRECLVITCVDFSHDQPASLASIHDILSIRALSLLSEALIEKAEVDSVRSLMFAIKWAKLCDTMGWNLFDNTNSGLINKNSDGKSTSYVLGWYEAKSGNSSNESFSFMFAGDMMFGRNVDAHFRGDKIFDIFNNLGDRFFQGVDLSMANLEGPISSVDLPVNNEKNNLVFNFPPKTTQALSKIHLNSVGLANNHTLNQGRKGILNTQQVLGELGITWVGQDATFDSNSIRRFEAGGINVSVIALDDLNTNTDLRQIIETEKTAGSFVIVFPHWGVEYEKKHSYGQQKTAHYWIDSGADMIIGSHPHVVQDAEIYKGKPIFYSLGNFLFDQNFSVETQRGLVLAGNITKNELSIVLLPIKTIDFKPQLQKDEERSNIIMGTFSNLFSEKSFLNSDYSDTITLKR